VSTHAFEIGPVGKDRGLGLAPLADLIFHAGFLGLLCGSCQLCHWEASAGFEIFGRGTTGGWGIQLHSSCHFGFGGT